MNANEARAITNICMDEEVRNAVAAFLPKFDEAVLEKAKSGKSKIELRDPDAFIEASEQRKLASMLFHGTGKAKAAYAAAVATLRARGFNVNEVNEFQVDVAW